MTQRLDRITSLAPFLHVPAREFIALAQSSGVMLFVVHTWRSVAQQQNIYQQGRAYDRETQEWNITDPKAVLTKAKPGTSPHNVVTPDGKPAALAMDVIPMDAGGHLIWDTDDMVWDKLYELAWKVGLDPLGDPIAAYVPWDKGHFEEPRWKLKLAGLGLVLPSSVTVEAAMGSET